MTENLFRWAPASVCSAESGQVPQFHHRRFPSTGSRRETGATREA